MQTFLPYSDFEKSVQVLDYKRLGKQRVEAAQILDVLEGRKTGWRNHPAVKMWAGYADALRAYLRACILEWQRRGYKNNMPIPEVDFDYELPFWFGDERFHASHRSNLKRKDSKYYKSFSESPDMEYVWPVAG